MANSARVMLFVFCAWFSLVPYAQLFEYLSRFEPMSHDRVVVVSWLFAVRIVPAAITAALFAFPIAWAYGRAALWVGFLLSVPFVVVQLFLLPTDAKPLMMAICWATVVAYVLLVTGSIAFARRALLTRSINRSEQASPAA